MTTSCRCPNCGLELEGRLIVHRRGSALQPLIQAGSILAGVIGAGIVLKSPSWVLNSLILITVLFFGVGLCMVACLARTDPDALRSSVEEYEPGDWSIGGPTPPAPAEGG